LSVPSTSKILNILFTLSSFMHLRDGLLSAQNEIIKFI
jgi:hypothetical protein